VAPHDFHIEADIGAGNQPGVMRLRGLAGARVHIGPDSPAGISIDTKTEQVQLVCPSIPGDLPLLNLLLHWPGSEPITLDLPYPQRGAFFRQAGRPLPNDDWIPLDRLGGLHLVVQDPMGGQRFWLEGELIAHENGLGPRFHQGFYDRLRPLDQGRLDMALFPLQDRIASLLASSHDLQAQVRLVVKNTQNQRLALIRITRFDALLEPDRAMRQVRIPEPVLARLGPAWETRIRLEMIRLWAPAETPVILQASPSQTACWDIPADLEPGPWWIIGRDGNWMRFRPLLWVVATDNPPTADDDASLAGAIQEPDRDQRQQRLNILLGELGQNPDHPDWPLLFDYLRLAREFPPSSLDVLRCLPKHPRTLALALLKADDQTFETVWSLYQQMPFLWTLLAVKDWLEAATAYFGGLQTTLAKLDAGEEIVFGLFQSFRERTRSARRFYWRPLCDWLQELLFPEQPLKGSELSMARCSSQVMEQQIEPLEQKLMERHDAEEKWPESVEVMGWRRDIAPKYRFAHLAPFYQPVRCAPFVTAYLSLNGITPNERLIYELRLLRAFDREWFDNVYAVALALGLAQKSAES